MDAQKLMFVYEKVHQLLGDSSSAWPPTLQRAPPPLILKPTVWKDLEHYIIDAAMDQWRRRLLACVSAKGGYFIHNL